MSTQSTNSPLSKFLVIGAFALPASSCFSEALECDLVPEAFYDAENFTAPISVPLIDEFSSQFKLIGNDKTNESVIELKKIANIKIRIKKTTPLNPV